LVLHTKPTRSHASRHAPAMTAASTACKHPPR
jgi:hypothetical protein